MSRTFRLTHGAEMNKPLGALNPTLHHLTPCCFGWSAPSLQAASECDERECRAGMSCCRKPPCFAIALRQTTHTYENLKKWTILGWQSPSVAHARAENDVPQKRSGSSAGSTIATKHALAPAPRPDPLLCSTLDQPTHHGFACSKRDLPLLMGRGER